MNRRAFLACLAAGGIVTAEGLWIPGTKLISIPKSRHPLLTGEIGVYEGLSFTVIDDAGVFTREHLKRVKVYLERHAHRDLTFVLPATAEKHGAEISQYGELVIQTCLPD